MTGDELARAQALFAQIERLRKAAEVSRAAPASMGVRECLAHASPPAAKSIQAIIVADIKKQLAVSEKEFAAL